MPMGHHCFAPARETWLWIFPASTRSAAATKKVYPSLCIVQNGLSALLGGTLIYDSQVWLLLFWTIIMSYYYYFPETVGMGHGKPVGETELCVHAEGRPSIFIQGSLYNISGEKGPQY